MPGSDTTPEIVINDCWNKIGIWGNGECAELAGAIHCRNCPVYSNAASQLLDRDLPAGYLRNWTAYFTQEKKTEATGTHSVVVFRIGAEWLALPTGLLQEVAEMRPVHSLPHRRNTVVLGLVNIRGELLVCVSLGEVLGVEKAATEKVQGKHATFGRLFVANREGSRVVFPVDEVQGVHRFHPDELKPAPATVAHAKATYSRGILNLPERTVGCLDDQLLFYTINRSLG